VRFRYALIAILAALAAVATGAQAASGGETSSPSGTVKYEGKVERLKGPVKMLSSSKSVRASFGNDDFTLATLISNFATPGVCRAPGVCEFNDDNFNASLQGGEPNQCAGPGGAVNFDNTVWFRVNTGSITGFMNIQIEPTSAGLRPVFIIAPYDASTGTPVFPSPCNIANQLNNVYSERWTIRGSIAMAVASPNPPGTEGSYRVLLNWDPDSDGDNIVDTADRCDNARGPRSLGGGPDRDGDGVIDPRDACPDENSSARDANSNGCLDLAVFDFGAPPFKYRTFFSRGVPNGFTLKASLTLTGLPRGTVVRLKCSRKRICRKVKTRKTARRGRVSFKLKGRRVRPRESISIRVTHAGFIGKYFSWKAKKKGREGYTRKTRCTYPGSSRLLRCSRVNPVR
jgi:hypothetical protein